MLSNSIGFFLAMFMSIPVFCNTPDYPEISAVPLNNDQDQGIAAEDEIVNIIGMRLRRIASGSFVMGSEKSNWKVVKPAITVVISKPFYIGVYEVTEEQYKKIMGKNRYIEEHGGNYPVYPVSWTEAVKFCRRLSELEGRYYRLPTEAEWEYACRAGTDTEYYWGDEFDGDYAWCKENSEGRAHEVGTRKSNAWGLYDMLGNVPELCADRFDEDYYSRSPGKDPQGSLVGVYKVARGGWYLSSSSDVTCHYRRRTWPNLLYHDTTAILSSSSGLRIVLDITVDYGEMKRLEAEKAKAVEETYQEAKRLDTKSSWRNFLYVYPDSDHAWEAIFRLTKKMNEPRKEAGKEGAEEEEPPVDLTRFEKYVWGPGLMKLRLVPAGSFLMGSEKGNADERPVHRVTISRPFYISIHEVTMSQFESVMGKNRKEFPTKDFPAGPVTWFQAVEFCRRISEIQGYTYRLPTEAEWEYACRAGTDSEYYWGDELFPEYISMGDQNIFPVGSWPPNGWGLYDMSGNVWEWCLDWYDKNYYDGSPAVDPLGPPSGVQRVTRGGSYDRRSFHWPNPKVDLNTFYYGIRSAKRDNALCPDLGESGDCFIDPIHARFVGFRVVREVEKKK